MTSDVVQFRQDSERLEYLRALGVNPNEFGREAFEKEWRMLRAKKNMQAINTLRERLAKRLGGKPLFEKPVAQLIREDRDSH